MDKREKEREREREVDLTTRSSSKFIILQMTHFCVCHSFAGSEVKIQAFPLLVTGSGSENLRLG